MSKGTSLPRLRRGDADADPIRQFDRWFEEALAAGLIEPTAGALGTVGADGQPSVRMVLLKGFDVAGFVFYTNFESRKGRDLTENSGAALTFWWDSLNRQVRIEGPVSRIADEDSDAYFASRPRDSQIGAWASAQSRELGSREELEQKIAVVDSQYRDALVPRPPHWGGFRIEPVRIEFWQGRPSRLHDRFIYTRQDDAWRITRLSP